MLGSRLMLVIASVAAVAQCDDTTYDQNAGCNKDQLLRWFNSDTGLFYDDTGKSYWWQGANMLTVLAKFGKLDAGVKSQVTPIISDIYNKAGTNGPFANANNNKVRSDSSQKDYVSRGKGMVKRQYSKRVDGQAFYNTYYDDEGWWGLGFVAAWELTGTIDYLNMAIYIWNDMNSAWGKPACGGLYWNKNSGSPVVAIANELYIHLSAAIANNVGDNVKQTYVDAAKTAWTWFKNSGMINGQSLVNDGIDDSCKNNGEPTYTYNQGVILSGLAALYKATGDSSYLDAATPIANAAISSLVSSTGILEDGCDKTLSCGGDGEQFKGVFSRGLRDLYEQRPTDSWKSFLVKNAQTIWLNDTSIVNGGCMNGNYWAGPYKTADASTQSSALDTLVAAFAVTS